MPRWSRAELCQWVKDKQIYARDSQAGNATVPDWLLAASDGWGPGKDSADATERTHPDDRHILINSFIEALGTPGEVVPGLIRAHDIEVHDRWTTVRIEWLNLVDDPEVGCLVCAMLEVGSTTHATPLIAETGGFENTRWMVFDMDTSGVIRGVEGKVRETLGYEPDEVVGKLISDFIHPDALADGIANWVRMVGTPGATSTSRRPWRVKNGGHVWMEASYLHRGDDSVLAVVWDITEKRRQEQELTDLTAQFQILADEVPAAVFCCDLDGTVLFHNARWSALAADQPDATRLHALVSDVHQQELSATLAALATDAQGERHTIDVTSRDGASVWRVTLRSTGDRGAGRVTAVGSVEDVTATVRLETEARRDALTGVLNRHGLDEALGALANERNTLVVFLDLDGFKPVNDEFGHDTGDVVLTAVARRLSDGVRPGDIVARYGGDEFVVVCRDVEPGEEVDLVGRIEAAVSGPVVFATGQWDAAASIGAARLEPGDDAKAVLRRADRAMLEVKRDRHEAAGVPLRR